MEEFEEAIRQALIEVYVQAYGEKIMDNKNIRGKIGNLASVVNGLFKCCEKEIRGGIR